jgi:hypothetical protein
MDDLQHSMFQALAEETDGLADEVEAALDEHASFAMMLETRKKVDDLSHRFRDAKANLGDENDRATVDRVYGRRISDLLKMATRLPSAAQGKPAERIVDDSFFATRAPKSSRPPFVPGLQPGESRRKDAQTVRVTDEIDAWCGRCAMVRTQTVAAVVEGEPAQVVCVTCGSRARYREGPARVKKEAAAAKPERAKPSPAQREADAKQKEKNALLQTLQSAENVRAFSPKERYRVGEIIEHPEHGRGKIENTLPRSLLVRFAGGLKPVKLG